MQDNISPDIIDGESVTQMYLHKIGEGLNFLSELHIAHFPDGNIEDEPQYYNKLSNLSEEMLTIIFNTMQIPKFDRHVVEQMLGSFRWVRYHHRRNKDVRGGLIYLDVPAMVKGYWSKSYW
jgi:hypothetical protein